MVSLGNGIFEAFRLNAPFDSIASRTRGAERLDVVHPNPVQQSTVVLDGVSIQPSQRSPGFLMVKLWNELPFNEKDFGSISSFSNALSNFDWKNSQLCSQLFSRYSNFFVNPNVLGFQS